MHIIIVNTWENTSDDRGQLSGCAEATAAEDELELDLEVTCKRKIIIILLFRT